MLKLLKQFSVQDQLWDCDLYMCDFTYLPPPEGAGEFIACTMSVVSASNKLVMNSSFFPSGQPGKKIRNKKYSKISSYNWFSSYRKVTLTCFYCLFQYLLGNRSVF